MAGSQLSSVHLAVTQGQFPRTSNGQNQEAVFASIEPAYHQPVNRRRWDPIMRCDPEGGPNWRPLLRSQQTIHRVEAPTRAHAERPVSSSPEDEVWHTIGGRNRHSEVSMTIRGERNSPSRFPAGGLTLRVPNVDGICTFFGRNAEELRMLSVLPSSAQNRTSRGFSSFLGTNS